MANVQSHNTFIIFVNKEDKEEKKKKNLLPLGVEPIKFATAVIPLSSIGLLEISSSVTADKEMISTFYLFIFLTKIIQTYVFVS